MKTLEDLKRMCGEAAAREVNSGEIVGLGTGSTVYYTIRHLGEMVKDEGLGIIGIPTSKATEKLAQQNGISLGTLDEYQEIDIAIDGADQVDDKLNLIKGGGGAHVREKIVAKASKRFIIVVDESKLSEGLNMPVPVETLPFAVGLVAWRLEQLRGTPLLRLKESDYFITDNNNYILDVDFGEIEDPNTLEKQINEIPGVVDNGLFSKKLVSQVFVAARSGVEIIEP